MVSKIHKKDTKMDKLKSDQIIVETSTICPAHCVICPREKYIHKKQIMDFDLFKKIIDDAAQYHVKSLSTCGFGEPFTDNLLFKRFKYAKEKIPGIETYVASNCFLMEPSMFDNIIKYVDILKISFYGATKETYEKIHRGSLVFEKSLNNVLSLLEKINGLKKKPHTIGAFTTNGINQHEIRDWINFWEPKLDEVTVWKAHNWAGLKDYRKIDHKKQVSCGRPFNGPPFIHVDGTVSICCFDINGKLLIGDMKTQTLYDIFHSDAFKKLTEAHQKGQFKNYICYVCDQTNPDPSVLLYANNKVRKVGQLTSNLLELNAHGSDL